MLEKPEGSYEYSDKLNQSVIELNHIDMATDDGKKYGIDKWARLFKSTTWEEVRMIAASNEHIKFAARSMYKKELDEATLRLCRKTEEEIAGDEYRRKRIPELEAENAALTTKSNEQASTISTLNSTINTLTSTINEQNSTINELSSTVEQLKRKLELLEKR